MLESGRDSLVERLSRAGFIVVTTVSESSDRAVLLEELGGGGLSHRPTAIGVYGGAAPSSTKTPWLAASEPLDEGAVVDWFARRLA